MEKSAASAVNPGNASSPAERKEAETATLFAQQPILDTQQRVVAYELLFRGDFDAVDGYSASARVFLNAFDEDRFRGGDKSTPMFVNFTEDLLFNLPPFDPDSFVIELLETIEPTTAVVQQVQLLKQSGYRIALDDFVYSDAMIPLLKIADIVKVDVMDTDMAEVKALVPLLRSYNVTLLAEKVEDHETFDQCRALGFDWYQGYFFARPKQVQGKAIGPNKNAVLSMVAALQQPDLDPAALETIIESDSGLIYKVLRLCNSAAMRRSVHIDSVKKAISMLGLHKLQNFATLMALAELNEKPHELQIYTTYRGLLCERIGALLGSEFSEDVFQTVGILSCCDAYFDDTLDNLIPRLPLSEAVQDALLHHSGELGVVLRAAGALQEGRWDEIDWAALEFIGLEKNAVMNVFTETSSWAANSADVEIW
ncbi:MAG: EAL and HDOD domain-containing protein [bacterium]